MLNVLNYNKPLLVNGQRFNNSAEAYEALKDFKGHLEIKLNISESTASNPPAQTATTAPISAPASAEVVIYRIEVRQYMTKKSTPDFDLMKKYNKDVPMPLRVMYGEIVEEKGGMIKMKLHGRAEKNAVQCSHCMRELTHPVSRIYGIGPICGEHYWQSNDWMDALIADEEALFKAVDKKMRNITWEGWMPRKAIITQQVVERIKKAVSA